jgi:vitellogenic carboxypeptidase-like protein
MACLLPRVAAASLPVVILTTTASTSPAAAQTFPASERPTRSGYVNPPSAATSPSSAPTSSVTQPASPATPTSGVFLDNPLGAGFSAPASDHDVTKDEPTVAKSFMAVLDKSFRARPLFLTGGS